MAEAQAVPFAGIEVVAGGATYVVPPVTLGWLRRNAAVVEQVVGMPGNALPSADQLGAVVALVHGALARNYPALTVAEVEDLVDFGNLPAFLAAVMAQAGFKKGGGAAGEG